ncbi:hypothetical protein MPSEU_000055100 [Mayamaea pseudoterrestris]|nr:hypothetical protein MPSEU_000055100 [Mayamaea pseudoterrestris]
MCQIKTLTRRYHTHLRDCYSLHQTQVLPCLFTSRKTLIFIMMLCDAFHATRSNDFVASRKRQQVHRLSPNVNQDGLLQDVQETPFKTTESLEQQQHDFILVTPDSIGMDRNGNVAATPTMHTFRPIQRDNDDVPEIESLQLLLSQPRSGNFHLPMKRSTNDPFESLMF